MNMQLCNICRAPTSASDGYALSRGNILPTFRLCDTCGNALKPVVQKLEMLTAVEQRLGLDRVIAA